MEDLLVKFATIYGPLGLGWVAALYLVRRLQVVQDKVMSAFLADTELKASLKASVDQLIDTVKDIKRG